MVEEVGGKDIPFSAITVEWLQMRETLVKDKKRFYNRYAHEKYSYFDE